MGFFFFNRLEKCAPDSEDIQACIKQLSVLRKKL